MYHSFLCYHFFFVSFNWTASHWFDDTVSVNVLLYILLHEDVFISSVYYVINRTEVVNNYYASYFYDYCLFVL